ncbi:MAG: hypothetical protein AAGI01_11150 [Myxococcota bacterium]
MHLAMLLDPTARSAYFADTMDVAMAEFALHYPGVEVTHTRIGAMDFLRTSLPEQVLAEVTRMSCVLGVFAVDEASEQLLEPLDVDPGFILPADLVFGAKYRGKTNELVTQLAINAACRFCASRFPPRTLLDPMAGRGTTLLWALRYGMDARGVEPDHQAVEDLHRHIKRQTKLHRIKHDHQRGFVGKKNKRGDGQFTHYALGGHTARLITGDSRDAQALLANQRFDLVVADLPYGIQHGSRGAKGGLRGLVEACAPAWIASMREGGAMALIYNTYRPTREELTEIFFTLGCTVQDFTAPHRMSESIVRDVLVVTR